MSERILLEYNEEAFNSLVERQEIAESALQELVNYCQDTLQIEITDLKAFFNNPKKYCVDAYWDKYGKQFEGSPVQKDKLLNLTSWNENRADELIQNAKRRVNTVSGSYEITEEEIRFKRDPESFKTYLKEEDKELYELAREFIEVAQKMEAKGGKPAWYLARYYSILSVDGDKLIPSKSYFQSSERVRKLTLGSFMS